MLRSFILSLLVTALLVNSGNASHPDGEGSRKRPCIDLSDVAADWGVPSEVARLDPPANIGESVFVVPFSPQKSKELKLVHLTMTAATAHMQLIRELGKEAKSAHYFMTATSLDAAGYHAVDPTDKLRHYRSGVEHVKVLLSMKPQGVSLSDLTLAISIYRGVVGLSADNDEKIDLYVGLTRFIKQKFALPGYSASGDDYICLMSYYSGLAHLLTDAEVKKSSFETAVACAEQAIRFAGFQPTSDIYKEAAILCGKVTASKCTDEELKLYLGKGNLYTLKQLVAEGKVIEDLKRIMFVDNLLEAGRAATNGDEKHYLWSEGAEIANYLLAKQAFKAGIVFYRNAWLCNWFAGKSTSNTTVAANYLCRAARIKTPFLDKLGGKEVTELFNEANDLVTAGLNDLNKREELYNFAVSYIKKGFEALGQNATADQYNQVAGMLRYAATSATSLEKRKEFLNMAKEYADKATALKKAGEGE